MMIGSTYCNTFESIAKEFFSKSALHIFIAMDSFVWMNIIHERLLEKPAIIPDMTAVLVSFLKYSAPTYIGRKDAAHRPKNKPVLIAIESLQTLGRTKAIAMV